jgi:hypothetical protein
VRVDVLHLRERCGERGAGDLHDLQRPDDPTRVVRQDPGGRIGVQLRQLPVQLAGPDGFELRLPARPDRVVGAGEVEPVQDRPGVERRPSDEHGRGAVVAQLRDNAPRPLLEVRHCQRLAHVEEIEQVVPDAAALVGRQLRCTDVHAAVDLHGVGVDDLAAERLGQVERQPGLSGRGATHHGDDRGRIAGAGHVASLARRPAPSGCRPAVWGDSWDSSTRPKTS